MMYCLMVLVNIMGNKKSEKTQTYQDDELYEMVLDDEDRNQ